MDIFYINNIAFSIYFVLIYFIMHTKKRKYIRHIKDGYFESLLLLDSIYVIQFNNENVIYVLINMTIITFILMVFYTNVMYANLNE